MARYSSRKRLSLTNFRTDRKMTIDKASKDAEQVMSMRESGLSFRMPHFRRTFSTSSTYRPQTSRSLPATQAKRVFSEYALIVMESMFAEEKRVVEEIEAMEEEETAARECAPTDSSEVEIQPPEG